MENSDLQVYQRVSSPPWITIAELDPNLISLKNSSDVQQLELVFEEIMTTNFDLLEESDGNEKKKDIIKLCKVMQCILEMKQQMLQEADVKISNQTQDILHLESIANATEGNDSVIREFRILQEEISDLQQRNHYTVKDLQIKESELEREKIKTNDFQKQLSENKERILDLEDQVIKLRRETQNQAKPTLSRNYTKLGGFLDEETKNQLLKEKNNEISKYLEEIKNITEKNRQLELDIESLTNELEVALEALETNERQQTMINSVIKKNDEDVSALRKERDTLQAQLDQIAQQLNLKDDIEDSILNNLQQQVTVWRSTIATLQNTIAEKDNLIDKLQDDIKHLKLDIQELGIEGLRKQSMIKDEEIKTLKTQIENLAEEYEFLNGNSGPMFKNDHSDMNAFKASTLSLKMDIMSTKQLKLELETLKSAHHANLERLRLSENLLAEKEDQLITLRNKVDQLESGLFGLKEALEEISSLKLDRSIRDKNILDLTEQVNQLYHVVDDLTDENTVLREKLGLKDEKVNISQIRTERNETLEKVQALNEQFKREIEDLEEERVKLKKELRILSISKNEKSVSAGLSPEEWVKVEEYIHALKKNERKRLAELETSLLKQEASLDSNTINLAKALESMALEMKIEREKRYQLQGKMESWRRSHELTKKAFEVVVDNVLKRRESEEIAERLNDILEELKRVKFTDAEVELGPEIAHDLSDINSKLTDELEQWKEKCKTLQIELDTVKKDANEIHILEKNKDPEAAVEQSPAKQPEGISWFEKVLESLLAKSSEYNVNSWTGFLIDQLVEQYQMNLTNEKSVKMTEEQIEIYISQMKNFEAHVYRANQKLTQEKEKRIQAESQLKRKIEDLTASNDSYESLKQELKSIDISANVEDKQQLIRQNLKFKHENLLLARNLFLKEAELKNLKSDLKLSEQNLNTLDEVSRKVISKLRCRLSDSKLKISILQRKMVNSVPIEEYKALESDANLTKLNLRASLEKEREIYLKLTDKMSSLRGQRVLEDQIAELASQITLLKDKADLYQNQFEKSIAETSKEELIVQKLQLEISLNNSNKKLELLNSRVLTLNAEMRKLETEREALENNAIIYQTEIHKLRENDILLQTQLSRLPSFEEYNKMVKDLDEKEANLLSLQDQLNRQKDLAETAIRQVQDIQSRKASEEKEISKLKELVEELSLNEETKLILAKSRQNELCLELRENKAMKLLSDSKERLNQLALMLSEAYSEIERRDELLWLKRLEWKHKYQNLEQKYNKWKFQYASSSLGLFRSDTEKQSFMMPPSLREVEHHNLIIRRLHEEYSYLSKKSNKDNIKTNFEDFEIHKAELKQLIAESPKNMSKLLEKINNYQLLLSEKKMIISQLQMKLKESDEELERSKQWISTNNSRFEILESTLIQEQTSFEQEKFSWEQRESELEAKIAKFDEDIENALSMTSKTFFQLINLQPEVSDTIKNTSMKKIDDIPLSKQLEESLTKLLDLSKELTKEKAQSYQLKVQLKEAEFQLEKMKSQTSLVIEEKEKIPEVKHEVVTSNNEESYRKHVNVLESKLQISYDVVESLKRQLSFSEEQKETLRERLSKANADLTEQQLNSRKEIQELKKEVSDLNQRLVSSLAEKRLSKSSLQLTPSNPNTGNEVLFNSKDLQLAMEDLERKFIEKCGEYDKMKRDNTLLETEREFWMKAAQSSAKSGDSGNGESSNSIQSKQQNISDDNMKDYDMRNKELERQIRSMKKELVEKKQTIIRLEGALLDMKNQLVMFKVMETHEAHDLPANVLRERIEGLQKELRSYTILTESSKKSNDRVKSSKLRLKSEARIND